MKNDYGITGALWEGGNEVYSTGTQTPGMAYPGTFTNPKSYVLRYNHVVKAIKGQDSAAQLGVVVHEFGVDTGTTATLLQRLAAGGVINGTDFYILHDYAPLVPRVQKGASAPEFYQQGVEKALAFQYLVSTIKDFKDWRQSNCPDQSGKPVYVTEYGTLHYNFPDDVPGWLSRWYNKGVAILLMHHYLDLIAQGADGLWFWDAFGKMFRLIDPDAKTATALYHVMKKLFALRGTLIELEASGSTVFDVKGPVGSGCVEGFACNYWHLAVAAGDVVEDLPYLKAYAVLNSRPLKASLSVIVLNFAPAAQEFSVTLEGGLGNIKTTSWKSWQVSATDWEASLSAPSTSLVTTTVAKSSSVSVTHRFGTVPARSATVFEVDASHVGLPVSFGN